MRPGAVGRKRRRAQTSLGSTNKLDKTSRDDLWPCQRSTRFALVMRAGKLPPGSGLLSAPVVRWRGGLLKISRLASRCAEHASLVPEMAEARLLARSFARSRAPWPQSAVHEAGEEGRGR